MEKQQVLTVEVNGKEVVSKPFDFEALCRINDAHWDETVHGPINYGRPAVVYMFEGTAVTEKVLGELPMAEMGNLCMKAWDFYADVMVEMNKKQKNG